MIAGATLIVGTGGVTVAVGSELAVALPSVPVVAVSTTSIVSPTSVELKT